MNSHQDPTPGLVRLAVEGVLRGGYDAAESALYSIDYGRLVSDRKAALKARRARLALTQVWDPGESREQASPAVRARIRSAVPASTRQKTFARDHFLCRYSHCRKRTIYIPVLRALSALFPEVIPYHKNWRPLESHILYWTYGASLEHKLSFPHGGTSDPENLITACYQCNDIKNMIRASDLGWELADIEASDWDGLSSYVGALREVVAPKEEVAPKRVGTTSSG